jgi:hypothetical protein
VAQRRPYGQPSPRALDADDTEAFRLVTIRHAGAPEGCVGPDWLVYEIVQGKNRITGYRRGTLPAATSDVEKIVVGLNERRGPTPAKPRPPQLHTVATAATAVAPIVASSPETASGATAGDPR